SPGPDPRGRDHARQATITDHSHRLVTANYRVSVIGCRAVGRVLFNPPPRLQDGGLKRTRPTRYYDEIVRGYSDESRPIGGGVGFSDSGAVARGHMHWTNTSPSAGDLTNAAAWSQQYSGYHAWVASWDGWK